MQCTGYTETSYSDKSEIQNFIENLHLHQWFSNCLQISSISSTWELIRHANLGPLPELLNQNSGGGAQQSMF